MNYGPLIFLAALFGLASSWLAFVLTPQMQVGQLQQTNSMPAGVPYPVARPGLAQQGAEVYRANGCAYCHSQQVIQTGTTCDVLLTNPGTNHPAVVAALTQLKPGLSAADAQAVLGGDGKTVLRDLSRSAADAAVKTLTASGAKATVWVAPVGPDISRGLGKRRSVARDFLFDYPVMLGSQRVGPDLANVGMRLPDANWHLRHLYAPASEVKGSSMPSYPFLFELRRIERAPSPDAMQLPPGFAPRPGFEVVPRPEAKALAAYLASLRATDPLFEAPLSVVSAAPAASATNAPAAAPGNASGLQSTNAPAK